MRMPLSGTYLMFQGQKAEHDACLPACRNLCLLAFPRTRLSPRYQDRRSTVRRLQAHGLYAARVTAVAAIGLSWVLHDSWHIFLSLVFHHHPKIHGMITRFRHHVGRRTDAPAFQLRHPLGMLKRCWARTRFARLESRGHFDTACVV